MLFNSGQFLIFFPIVVLVYFCIPQKIKNIWLLIASYYFYMCWNAKYALLLLTASLITYIGSICIENIKNLNISTKKKFVYKKIILIISLVINIGILVYYKYINFLVGLLGDILLKFNISLNIPVFDIILPVGISFYIFQALGYLIDVYRGDIYAEKNIIRYMLFVSFFPQLVAGPIERSKNLLKQLAVHDKFEYNRVRVGLLTMLWGFFLKLVIADRSAVFVNTVYASYEQYSGFQILTANILFAIQIYCDFMGYSTIAKGAAKVMGVDLMNNFEQPYFSTSIKEFWRRWHISLSSWFRDYLYIPLGGSRGSKLKTYGNVLITFMTSGLWHGANLTFVIWGLMHGIYQIIEDVLKPFTDLVIKKFAINMESFSWKFIRILKTFIFVDIAWIFFRADTVTSAVEILKKSFDISNYGLILNDGLYSLGLNAKNMNILFISLIILLIAGYIREKKIDFNKWLINQNILFRYGIYWTAMILIILSLDITGQEFIYFQF